MPPHLNSCVNNQQNCVLLLMQCLSSDRLQESRSYLKAALVQMSTYAPSFPLKRIDASQAICISAGQKLVDKPGLLYRKQVRRKVVHKLQFGSESTVFGCVGTRKIDDLLIEASHGGTRWAGWQRVFRDWRHWLKVTGKPRGFT